MSDQNRDIDIVIDKSSTFEEDEYNDRSHDIYDDIKNELSIKPHNGHPITKMEISSNEEYLVTYSEKDKTIVGWNVHNDEYKPNGPILNSTISVDQRIFYMCVSNNNVLAYLEYYDETNTEDHYLLSKYRW